MKPLRVEFYHTVVCSWCYINSPRLRTLADELNLDVHHRACVQQRSRAEMIEAFGSMPLAKEAALRQWQKCVRIHGDDNSIINIEGMRKKTFEYPCGMLGSLACKAAELRCGQNAHWDMFDLIQYTLFNKNMNIEDPNILLSLAFELGWDIASFNYSFNSQEAINLVSMDCEKARGLNISTFPTLVVQDKWVVSGALPLDELKRQLLEIEKKVLEYEI